MRLILILVWGLWLAFVSASALANDDPYGAEFILEDAYWLEQYEQSMSRCNRIEVGDWRDKETDHPSCPVIRRDLKVLDCQFRTAEEINIGLSEHWLTMDDELGVPRYVASAMRENPKHVGGEEQRQKNIEDAWALVERAYDRAARQENDVWDLVDAIELKASEFEAHDCDNGG